MSQWIRRPSPALVVACLSLAVSLSGWGYAATVLPKNSVGTPQLKKNAVTSLKVKNRSLLAAVSWASFPRDSRGRKETKGTRGTRGTPVRRE